MLTCSKDFSPASRPSLLRSEMIAFLSSYKTLKIIELLLYGMNVKKCKNISKITKKMHFHK